MRRRVCLSACCVSFASLTAAGRAAAAPVQWSGNGHYYQVVTSPKLTWTAADQLAPTLSYNGLPGHLATLTSAAEDGFVANLVGGINATAWIGLTNDPAYGGGVTAASPAGYEWVTGEPFAYTSWAAGEPNNVNASEHYAILNYAGPWYDEANYASNYVVEYEAVPEPAAAAVAGVAAVGLTVRRPRTAARR